MITFRQATRRRGFGTPALGPAPCYWFVLESIIWAISLAVAHAGTVVRQRQNRQMPLSTVSDVAGEGTLLIIEAGDKGWQLIEYQELLASAREHFGDSRVQPITISAGGGHLAQMERAIRDWAPSHYFIDPRTGRQGALHQFVLAMRILFLLSVKGVIPVVWLTDVPVRRWRRFAWIVTAYQGIILTLMSNKLTRSYFPHDRVLGPMPMALSAKTATHLRTILEDPSARPREVGFVGALYEPRQTFLRDLSNELAQRGIVMRIRSRDLRSPRIPNAEYWSALGSSLIQVTTASQLGGPGIDNLPYPHFLFRYTEALAAGAVLIAPIVDGSDQIYVANEHFASYSSLEEAVEVICEMLSSSSAYQMARRGQERVLEMTRNHFFWRMVENHLNKADEV